ncbi:MAG TPA: histidine phosphatase family protein [Candidatus Binatia bacterium]|nr:histidine phosphatase family protein [Candidatus Binatia bacterium]
MQQASLARLDVLLVRHAESVPPGTPGWEERDDERPLSEEGLRQADDLAFELDPWGLTAVYSSPYERALQTVAPVARRRGLEVQVLPDLRERRLTDGPRDDWPDVLARAWTDPSFAVDGAESGAAAQRRGIGVLDLLRVRHADGGRLLVGTHGNLISLILQAFEPGVGLDFHLAMPNPAIYHLEHDGVGWRVMGGHGFVEIARGN